VTCLLNNKQSEKLIITAAVTGGMFPSCSPHTPISPNAIAKEIKKTDIPTKKPACILSGGETTVTIRGNGLGGRNQEFALAIGMELNGWDNIVVLSAGTDGTDGPTDAAGAIADGEMVKKAEEKGLSPLEYLLNNDSYHLFEKIGDLFKTGPTNTNVMDLRIILVKD